MQDLANDVLPVAAAAMNGDQRAVLEAAHPLLRRLGRDFGFSVMRAGLPEAPNALADALALLANCVISLSLEFGIRK